jgi:hypothetical protein
VDENRVTYKATAEDAACAMFHFDGGLVVQLSASWAVRPYRDDLLVMHVDGETGSAMAGLHRCLVQPAATTPRFVWNPDVPLETGPRSYWAEVPDLLPPVNAFRHQWERKLPSFRHKNAGGWTYQSLYLRDRLLGPMSTSAPPGLSSARSRGPSSATVDEPGNRPALVHRRTA